MSSFFFFRFLALHVGIDGISKIGMSNAEKIADTFCDFGWSLTLAMEEYVDFILGRTAKDIRRIGCIIKAHWEEIKIVTSNDGTVSC